jgi:hypothetical protein
MIYLGTKEREIKQRLPKADVKEGDDDVKGMRTEC